MIIERFSQTELEFGTGDIGVTSGSSINSENNNRVGIVTFINQVPRELGTESDVEVGEECDIEDFPIIMSFSKTESIDVIIEALLNAKKEMENYQI